MFTARSSHKRRTELFPWVFVSAFEELLIKVKMQSPTGEPNILGTSSEKRFLPNQVQSFNGLQGFFSSNLALSWMLDWIFSSQHSHTFLRFVAVLQWALS